MPPLIKRLLNLSLRAATLVSKFALIFVLAKFLEPAEVGLYGLVSATVGYCLFVVGLEFYTYSMRELIASPPSAQPSILHNQIVFYLLAYAIFLPFFIFIFSENFLPWEIAYWFYAILILEHVAQELNRILIALSLQLEASFVLFLRSGAWGLVLILVMWTFPSLRSLHAALAAWSIGAVIACALGVWWIVRKLEVQKLSPIDWRWIRKGIGIALPMLAAALAIRGLFTFDRYWIEALGGFDTLGAYVLFAGIAGGIISFLDAGVVVFFYPRLISAARNNKVVEFKTAMKSLNLNVLLATSILVALAVGASTIIVNWIDKPAYSENFHLLLWLLLAMFIYGLSHTPHLGLYSQGKNRTLVLSHLAALLAFITTTICLSGTLGATAVPIALCAAFLLILLWKTLAYRRMINELNSTK